MAKHVNVKLKVCQGCLSADRSLIDLDDYETKIFYSFTKIDRKADTLQLCWECKAILRKFIKFKQQVKHAHFILNSYTDIEMDSLSSLVVKKYDTITEIIYNEKMPINIEIPFIKIEEDHFNDTFNECNDDFLTCDNDDSQVKVDIKDDNQCENVKINSNKEKINAKEDFNESDDEPLITRKERKKRTRKENDKKHKVKRRELPSGVICNDRIKQKLEKLNMATDRLQLVMLSWEEVEEERLKTLESETFKRHSYQCHDCAIGFNHKCKLDNHMKKHDKSNGDAECAVCHIRCRDAHALAAHKRRHRVKYERARRWRCSTCQATWSRAALCADHVARAHGGPAPTHACTCGFVATTLAKLRNHEKNHAERPKCELCGKSFRDKTSLKTHLFIHNGEKEFECPRCNKKFLFKKAMEVHLVTHDASAQLYCHVCDKNFKNKMSFNQHLKYNLKHIDPARLKYACQLCEKKFVNGTRLEEHNLAVHLKLTPISCTLPGCNFSCSSRTVLRTHRRMQHRAARLLRNHVCDVCGKTYTTKKCLEGHIRTHTGERPFRCTKCPAAFGYEAVLYNHNKLVHLKTKPNRRNAE